MSKIPYTPRRYDNLAKKGNNNNYLVNQVYRVRPSQSEQNKQATVQYESYEYNNSNKRILPGNVEEKPW